MNWMRRDKFDPPTHLELIFQSLFELLYIVKRTHHRNVELRPTKAECRAAVATAEAVIKKATGSAS